MTASHAGNIGDIIYSLPTFRELGGGTISLRVSRLLPRKFADDLRPLLESQPYVKRVIVDENGNVPIDVELDAFRRRDIQLVGGHIGMWYNHTSGVFPDLSQKWIYANKNTKFFNAIIINRTKRYREDTISYELLNKVNRPKYFWGNDAEYEQFSYYVPCERLIFENYMELAEAIAGCYCFIGNTSFAYSLAEAMKVKRIVEVPRFSPNAFPIGAKGYQFSFQDMFDKILATYL